MGSQLIPHQLEPVRSSGALNKSQSCSPGSKGPAFLMSQAVRHEEGGYSPPGEEAAIWLRTVLQGKGQL